MEQVSWRGPVDKLKPGIIEMQETHHITGIEYTFFQMDLNCRITRNSDTGRWSYSFIIPMYGNSHTVKIILNVSQEIDPTHQLPQEFVNSVNCNVALIYASLLVDIVTSHQSRTQDPYKRTGYTSPKRFFQFQKIIKFRWDHSIHPWTIWFWDVNLE